jgi:hypothetical protein
MLLFVLVWEKSENFRNHAAMVSGARLIVVKSTINQHSPFSVTAQGSWKYMQRRVRTGPPVGPKLRAICTDTS